MMQANEIQQRMTQVEQSVHHAAKCCETATTLPMDIKDSVQELDQKVMQARETMQSSDENQMRQCIEDLEQLGDRAKDACEQSSNIDGELRDAIMQAHRELSDLKHQMLH
jgi:methyl-accepting chemotaxis protein